MVNSGRSSLAIRTDEDPGSPTRYGGSAGSLPSERAEGELQGLVGFDRIVTPYLDLDLHGRLAGAIV